ncbi:MAG: DUF1570 domain-containing protein [Planctomycetales bacterium]|jgi:hypothetical protein|nr:DUF1570 domain-containing protein [Planctomycetales bacterium]
MTRLFCKIIAAPMGTTSEGDFGGVRCRTILNIRRWWFLALGVIATFGCRLPSQPSPIALPTRHSVDNDHLRVRSDIRLPPNHPLLRDLDRLRVEISETLFLPDQRQSVTVYLFEDEAVYSQYLQLRYPQLPPRRAYFVGTLKELAVYTYWSEKIQEDLRHEYTHGVLHASLPQVPLWLDEGLAEYFEVASRSKGLNHEYATRLAADFSNGWRPNLERLESLEAVADMKKADYIEAWAWVHFMLHQSDDSRGLLISYLRELRSAEKPELLSARMRVEIPQAEERFAAHASSLFSGLATVGGKSL